MKYGLSNEVYVLCVLLGGCDAIRYSKPTAVNILCPSQGLKSQRYGFMDTNETRVDGIQMHFDTLDWRVTLSRTRTTRSESHTEISDFAQKENVGVTPFLVAMESALLGEYAPIWWRWCAIQR